MITRAGFVGSIVASLLVLVAASPAEACWWCWHGYHRHHMHSATWSVKSGSGGTQGQAPGGKAGNPFGGGAAAERARDGEGGPDAGQAQPELALAIGKIQLIRNPTLQKLASDLVQSLLSAGSPPSAITKIVDGIVAQEPPVVGPNQAGSGLEARLDALESRMDKLEKRERKAAKAAAAAGKQ